MWNVPPVLTAMSRSAASSAGTGHQAPVLGHGAGGRAERDRRDLHVGRTRGRDGARQRPAPGVAAVAQQHDPGRGGFLVLAGGRGREHLDRVQRGVDGLADRRVVRQRQRRDAAFDDLAVRGRRHEHARALGEVDQAEVDALGQQVDEGLRRRSARPAAATAARRWPSSTATCRCRASRWPAPAAPAPRPRAARCRGRARSWRSAAGRRSGAGASRDASARRCRAVRRC